MAGDGGSALKGTQKPDDTEIPAIEHTNQWRKAIKLKPIGFQGINGSLESPSFERKQIQRRNSRAVRERIQSFSQVAGDGSLCGRHKYSIIAASVFVAWLFFGTIFYRLYGIPSDIYDTTTGMAFYYTVQAGYSVGFGALVENGQWSQLYTIFHVLFGSGVIAGALTIFTHSMVMRAEKLRVELQNAAIMKDLDGDGLELHEDFCGKIILTLIKFRSLGVLVVWGGIGTIFACQYWDTPIITGIYFAVTALSTGGLYAPPNLDNLSMWFTGIWVMLGVPIYGFSIGHLAALLTDPYVERQFKRQFADAAHLDRKEFVSAVKQGKDEELDYAEYLEFCMKRAYGASDEQIQQLRDEFHTMDLDNDGAVTVNELKYRWSGNHTLTPVGKSTSSFS